jgi:hypothetical protein
MLLGRLAQRNVQHSGSNVYSTIPPYQSGEFLSDSCVFDILRRKENDYKQNYYNRYSVTSYELTSNLLSSTKQEESPWDRVFSSCITDAIRRYKLVNHVDDYDTTPAKPFLSAIKSLIQIDIVPNISFYKDAVKVTLNFNQREFIIDYDYEDPEFIFISTFEDDRLKIKEGKITTQLYEMLGSF